MSVKRSVSELEAFCRFLSGATYDDLRHLGEIQAGAQKPLAARTDAGLEPRLWKAYTARERRLFEHGHGWHLWAYVGDLLAHARQAQMVRWAQHWLYETGVQLSLETEETTSPQDEDYLILCGLGLKSLSAALLALGWRDQLEEADYAFLLRPYAEWASARVGQS